MKRLFPIIILPVLFLLSCSRSADAVGGVTYQGEKGEDTLSVETVVLEKGKLIEQISGSALIRGREEVWSIARTEGLITEVLVEPGSYVSRGEPLIKIEDELAYWEMKRAEQQFKAADFEYEGTKSSFESGAVTEREYNRSLAAWYTSRSAYEAALTAYEDCTLRAPLSGHVSRMDTSLTQGNLLSRGTAVLQIINSEEFLMTISAGQKEVGLIEKGSEARIFIESAAGLVREAGEVLDISAGSDGDTGNFPVRIKWENTREDLVKPGMTARVEIGAENSPESIIIPFESIVEREGKSWVFLALKEGDGYRAEPREITAGTRLGSRIEVDRGLAEGDVLILSGLTALYPGALLAPVFAGD